MKKFILSIAVLFIIIAGAGYAVLNVDWNRFNKEEYYTKINGDVTVEESTINTGEVIKTYWYEFVSYDKDGKSQILDVSAQKELREGAYLRIYVKDGNVVTSYDEVQLQNIPQQAKQHID